MTDHLLPPNANATELALEGATARISDVPVPNKRLWNPATCPPSHLPWLAWTLSVDTWNPAWSEPVKRQVIAASFDVHRVKGTIGALERALEALDLDNVEVTEWFDFAGDPYTFRVEAELSTRGLTETEESDIGAVIQRAKNVRSHLDRLRVYLTGRGKVPVITGALLSGEDITVFPYQITELESSGGVPVVLLSHYGADTVTLYPQ